MKKKIEKENNPFERKEGFILSGYILFRSPTILFQVDLLSSEDPLVHCFLIFRASIDSFFGDENFLSSPLMVSASRFFSNIFSFRV
jgi:hypothetical protein